MYYYANFILSFCCYWKASLIYDHYSYRLSLCIQHFISTETLLQFLGKYSPRSSYLEFLFSAMFIFNWVTVLVSSLLSFSSAFLSYSCLISSHIFKLLFWPFFAMSPSIVNIVVFHNNRFLRISNVP